MIVVTLAEYLERLKQEEGSKPESTRREVPTYLRLAKYSGLTFKTISKFANGHMKCFKADTLNSIINGLRSCGFDTNLSDILIYVPDETERAGLQ